MSVSVRPLVKDDWKMFAAIRLEALTAHPGVYSSNHAKESTYDEQEWQDWLSQQGKCVFGLFDGNELVGIAGIFTHGSDPSGATGVLGADYIRPSHRGQGFMRKLYEVRLNFARGHMPWKKAVIAHRKSNDASRRSNQQWGFRYTYTDKDQLWPDGGKEDQLWYELDLDELRKKQ